MKQDYVYITASISGIPRQARNDMAGHSGASHVIPSAARNPSGVTMKQDYVYIMASLSGIPRQARNDMAGPSRASHVIPSAARNPSGITMKQDYVYITASLSGIPRQARNDMAGPSGASQRFLDKLGMTWQGTREPLMSFRAQRGIPLESR
jgi:hypothetical protein